MYSLRQSRSRIISVARSLSFASNAAAAAFQTGKDGASTGAGCRPLTRSPRRRATKATQEWTDLKRQRFASSRHAQIWLAVRLARQLDWLLGALSRQERQLAYTAQGDWVHKPLSLRPARSPGKA